MVTPGSWKSWTWRKVLAGGRDISRRRPRRQGSCGRCSEADRRHRLGWSGRERRCRAGSSGRPETPVHPVVLVLRQSHLSAASTDTPPAPCRTSLGRHRAAASGADEHCWAASS
jgi:hypothetical protein